MTRTLDHLEAPQETPINTIDDVQKKNLFGPLSLIELDNVYNMVVSKHSFTLLEYNEAFKKLELLQADVDQNEGANLLVEKLKGQLKDAEAALLKVEGSGNVVDAMKVEQLKNTIGRLSLTLQTLQVVVEEKTILDAMYNALKERDFIPEVEECAHARMDFVKTMQVKRTNLKAQKSKKRYNEGTSQVNQNKTLKESEAPSVRISIKDVEKESLSLVPLEAPHRDEASLAETPLITPSIAVIAESALVKVLASIVQSKEEDLDKDVKKTFKSGLDGYIRLEHYFKFGVQFTQLISVDQCNIAPDHFKCMPLSVDIFSLGYETKEALLQQGKVISIACTNEQMTELEALCHSTMDEHDELESLAGLVSTPQNDNDKDSDNEEIDEPLDAEAYAILELL
ncbi:hypothetical protein L7F22_058402 [Adiantum nelumboides]|nr:hypothetical protein [Adiantum nelumboides]